MRSLLCLLLYLPLSAFGWSADGHAAIAQAAIAQLSPEQQHYFNDMAQALLSRERATKWRKPLVTASAFAQATVWPDSRRDLTLADLFKRFAKSTVPPDLAPFATRNTSQWHYVNWQYWDPSTGQVFSVDQARSRCKLKETGLLLQVWDPLLSSYLQASSPAQKGLILAFLGHLLADAYQPLHSLTALDRKCGHDAGGNGFCLVADPNKRDSCSLSLHRLWDQGFGVFELPLKRSVSPYSPVKINELLTASALKKTMIVKKADATLIYSASFYQKPDRNYERKAKRQVEQRSAAAVEALATLLRVLYGLDKDSFSS
jgi:hypothetical protein